MLFRSLNKAGTYKQLQIHWFLESSRLIISQMVIFFFLYVEMGTHPSYAWRSIMAAQSLVKKGYRWQVGNGLSLNILKDLHKPSTFTITPRPMDVPLDLTVSLLINPYIRA